MSGMLTIDADEVRAVADGLGKIESQLKNDLEQLTEQISFLDTALQYTDVGATAQLRQAITMMNQVSPLLQSAQTRLLQVVNDTLHLEQDIENGAARGAGSSAGGAQGPGGWQVQTNSHTFPVAKVKGNLNGKNAGRLKETYGVTYTGWSDTYGGTSSSPGSYGNIQAQALNVNAGVGVQLGGEDPTKWRAGAFVDATTASIAANGRWGSQNLGATGSAQASGPAGDVFLGWENGTGGFDVGGTLVSAQGSAGVDVAGANVGVTGGIGIQWHLGFSLGEKTEVKLGPFELGLTFGSAK